MSLSWCRNHCHDYRCQGNSNVSSWWQGWQLRLTTTVYIPTINKADGIIFERGNWDSNAEQQSLIMYVMVKIVREGGGEEHVSGDPTRRASELDPVSRCTISVPFRKQGRPFTASLRFCASLCPFLPWLNIYKFELSAYPPPIDWYNTLKCYIS